MDSKTPQEENESVEEPEVNSKEPQENQESASIPIDNSRNSISEETATNSSTQNSHNQKEESGKEKDAGLSDEIKRKLAVFSQWLDSDSSCCSSKSHPQKRRLQSQNSSSSKRADEMEVEDLSEVMSLSRMWEKCHLMSIQDPAFLLQESPVHSPCSASSDGNTGTSGKSEGSPFVCMYSAARKKFLAIPKEKWVSWLQKMNKLCPLLNSFSLTDTISAFDSASKATAKSNFKPVRKCPKSPFTCVIPSGGILKSVDHSPSPLLPIQNIPLLINSNGNENDRIKIFAKCEYLNPSGSIKIRRSIRDIDNLNSFGLNPNERLLVHSNSCLGLSGSLAATLKGFPSMCVGNDVGTETYSKMATSLSAFLVHADPQQTNEDILMQDISEIIPNSHQLHNPQPLKSCFTPPKSLLCEIRNQIAEKIDMIVCSHISIPELELAVELNQLDQETLVILGNIQNSTAPNCPSETEAKSKSKIKITRNYEIEECRAFQMTRHLIQREGLFCSERGGAVLCAAADAIRDFGWLDSNQSENVERRIVVILEESLVLHSRAALDFLKNDWMRREFGGQKMNNSFPPPPIDGAPGGNIKSEGPEGADEIVWWKDQVVGDIKIQTPAILDPDMRIQDAIDALKEMEMDKGVVQFSLPPNPKDVARDNQSPNVILGVTSKSHLESKLANGSLSREDTLGKHGAIFRNFRIVSFDTKLGVLVDSLLRDHWICIVVQQVFECRQKSKSSSSPSCVTVQSRKDLVLGLITEFDIISYIANIEEHHMKTEPSWNYS